MHELDGEYGNQGLHFITAYMHPHSMDIIEKSVTDIGFTYPVALDGFNDSRFSNPSLCHVWVIGVDGKVMYDGPQWEEAALAELQKVKYPMLGKNKVVKEVEPAATAFGSKEYVKAHKLATAVSYGDFSDEAIDDADYVIERVEDMVSELEIRAETHEIETSYLQSIICWEKLSAFAGFEDGSDYKAEIKRIKAIKEFGSEQKARREYLNARQKAWAMFDEIGEDDKKLLVAINSAAKVLREFIERHPKAGISAKAKDQAVAYEDWAESLKPAQKK